MMDLETWKETCLLYSRTRKHIRRVEAARSTIDEAFWKNDSWYVALSGGKDSTCVLSLVLASHKDIHSVWSDDEWWLPETKEYIERLKKSGIKIHQIQTRATHAEWFHTHQESSIPDIPTYAQSIGLTGCFLGLRAQENNRRRVLLRNKGLLFYAEKWEQWECNPIGFWDYMDVWTYIYSRKIDYNRAYDILARIGVSYESQRIGPLATVAGIPYGQLVTLKAGWPDLYNRFVEKYPEVRLYT